MGNLRFEFIVISPIVRVGFVVENLKRRSPKSVILL